MQNDKNKMHPQDIKNLIIFGLVSIALWTMYEIFVLSPKKEAAQERARIEKLLEKKEIADKKRGIVNPDNIVIKPRTEVISQATRLTIDNGVIFGSLKLQGGRLDDIALHEQYDTLERKKNVVILSPKNTLHPRFFEHGWVSQVPNMSLPDSKTNWSIKASSSKSLTKSEPVTLMWNNGQGLTFERKYTIDENYLITLEQTVINNTNQEIELFPYGLITQTGLPPNMQKMWIMHEGPIGFIGDELVQSTYNNLKDKQEIDAKSTKGWIGITDKYWLSSLIPAQDENTKFRFKHTPNRKDEEKGRFQTDYTGQAISIAPGESQTSQNHIFVGAKEVLKLEKYEKDLSIPNFDLAVDFGWFWFMTQPFFYAIHYLHLLIGNMGLAIITLTVLLRMATYPLTRTSFRSFAKMKQVNPKVMELRETYADNKQRLQEEIIKLYQKEEVNPMSGCFPILLQIPIFFSLYKVFFITIEMRHAPFYGWIQDLSAPDPTSIFNLFGLLPYDLPTALHIGVWPCLMLIVMLIQKKLNPPPQDNIQRSMMNIFPFFITFMMAGFASGLVIYWTFSALISMLQQMYIMKKLGTPIHLFGESADEAKLEKDLKEGNTPSVHPLSEMAEQEFEDALFHDDKEEEPKKISPPKPKKKKKK